MTEKITEKERQETLDRIDYSTAFLVKLMKLNNEQVRGLKQMEVAANIGTALQGLHAARLTLLRQ